MKRLRTPATRQARNYEQLSAVLLGAAWLAAVYTLAGYGLYLVIR
jgi:hypothetical protein